MNWIDTHCHLDAREFDADREAVVERASAAGVSTILIPAVDASNFDSVRGLAHRHGHAYALGIHPLYVEGSQEEDLDRLAEALQRWRDDERLVAVGEIGLDFFVAGQDGERQERFYQQQLKIARDAGLPVILHVRKSADVLLKGLRRIEVSGGICHAFNGSRQQADAFVERGFALGFGGTVTFDRSLNIRALAAELPDHAPVLETDAPDIPPQWLYKTASERAAGQTSRNEPAELPRIAESLAKLRGWSLEQTAERTQANARRVLPRLGRLPTSSGPGDH
jgi:TatD DNase family protein